MRAAEDAGPYMGENGLPRPPAGPRNDMQEGSGAGCGPSRAPAPTWGCGLENPSASLRSAPLLCTRSADEIIDFEPHGALSGEAWGCGLPPAGTGRTT